MIRYPFHSTYIYKKRLSAIKSILQNLILKLTRNFKPHRLFLLYLYFFLLLQIILQMLRISIIIISP